MIRRAFTLIELLTSIAILGILSSIAVVSLSSSRIRAAIARGLQFEASIQHAVGYDVVADWEFDDGAGTLAADSSGNGKNATLVNGPTWRCASTDKSYTPSGQGCVLSFNGVNTYVSTAVSGVSDGTISLWFYNLSSSAGSVILGKRTPGCYSSAIYINNPPNSNDLRIYNGGPEVTIGAVNPNQWNHLAIVRTGAGAEADFYVNGALVFKNAYALNLNDLVANIGASCTGASPFHGYIDNIRIFSTALSASRIDNLYAEELPAHQSTPASNIISFNY